MFSSIEKIDTVFIFCFSEHHDPSGLFLSGIDTFFMLILPFVFVNWDNFKIWSEVKHSFGTIWSPFGGFCWVVRPTMCILNNPSLRCKVPLKKHLEKVLVMENLSYWIVKGVRRPSNGLTKNEALDVQEIRKELVWFCLEAWNMVEAISGIILISFWRKQHDNFLHHRCTLDAADQFPS